VKHRGARSGLFSECRGCSLPSLDQLRAGINRLYTFAEFLEQTETTSDSSDQKSTIQMVEADHLAVEHLTLKTPNHQRTLKDLSVELHRTRLLVMGPSGCGKSSLLRAIWDYGMLETARHSS